MGNLAILRNDENLQVPLERIRALYRLDVVEQVTKDYDLYFTLDQGRLALIFGDSQKVKPFFVDFTSGEYSYLRKKGLKRGDLFLKAIGFKGKGLRIFDSSAGWLKDSFMLSYIGCQVVAVERNNWVFELTADAWSRTQQVAELEFLSSNMNLIFGEASAVLKNQMKDQCFDVIFFDPMFDAKKNTALPGKEMQFMQAVTSNDRFETPAQTLELLLNSGVKRVVVKRGINNPVLLREPNLQMKGKSVRYDIYFNASIDESV